MDGYTLSRRWFDFAFENPDIIKPTHAALYFFAIEHCNRLGWKDKFRFPATMAMEAIGVRSYNTYKAALEDLVNWKFIDMIERSKNQYSSNVIALSKFDEPTAKALDKAIGKHSNRLVFKDPEPEFEPEILGRIQTAVKVIAGFFGINETQQANHWIKIQNFIEYQARNNQLDYLSEQFTAYRILKEKKGYKHTWMNWIGSPSDQPKAFCEGAWNEQNWTKVLEESKKLDPQESPSSSISYTELAQKTLKLSNEAN